MAKKSKIKLQQSQDMETIDAELAAAMDALDVKNNEVEGLLAEYVPAPEDPTQPEQAEPNAGEYPESP